MAGHARSTLIVALGLVLFALTAPGGTTPAAPMSWTGARASPATAYQEWLTRFARKDLTGRYTLYSTNLMTLQEHTTRLKLLVMVMTGDETVETNRGYSYGGSLAKDYYEVATNGYVSDRHTSRSVMDGGSRGSTDPSPLTAADLKLMDQLLAQLPGDGGRLPPAGRRMLLQAMVGDHLVARVYDLATAPDLIWEILRLGRCRIYPWVLTISPKTILAARRPGWGGFLCQSPDQRTLLYTDVNGPLQCWEPVTHELLAEIPHTPWDAIAFSPDGSQAVVAFYEQATMLDAQTWKTIRKLEEPPEKMRTSTPAQSQFTPDGRYFLTQSVEYPVRVFDTRNWQRTNRPASISEDAAQYFPSPSGKLALVHAHAGMIYLWDCRHHRVIAKLDDGADVFHAVFSPDESLVAAVTAPRKITLQGDLWPVLRIRVWHTGRGNLMHELGKNDPAIPQVAGLLWTPDGRYLLAAIERNVTSEFGIGIFNVKNGRHYGDLVGPDGMNGMILLPDSGEVVSGSEDGRLRFWDLNAVLKQIGDFETSLGF